MAAEAKQKGGGGYPALEGAGAEDDGQSAVARRFAGPKTVLLNFVVMSVCFSVNHGTVTALIALSSSNLPEKLSGQSVGALYVCYTLSALFFANSCVAKVGPKWTIFLGCTLYCAYVGSFLVANNVAAGGVMKAACIGGGIIGGLGAGVLWTAQGKFFAASADLYASLKGVSKESSTATLATVFTSIFLGFEFTLKIFTSLPGINPSVLYVVFTILAVASSLGLLFVVEVTHNVREQMGAFSMFEKATAALNLYTQDIKVLLLVPYSFTFGFAAPFLNQYVNAKITTEIMGPCTAHANASTTVGPMYMGNEAAGSMYFGPVGNHSAAGSCTKHSSEYVGYMSAIVVATGFITSAVFGALNKADIVPKAVPMVFASVCFTTVAAMFVALPETWFSSWVRLVPLYMLFGIGRGVFESTSKAVFADFFQGPRATAGFANSAMQNGLSGSIGFFVFPLMDYHYKAYIVVICGVVGIATYLVADNINKQQKKQRQLSINDNSAEDDPLLGDN